MFTTHFHSIKKQRITCRPFFDFPQNGRAATEKNQLLKKGTRGTRN